MDKIRHIICGVNPAFDLTLELDALDTDRVNRVRRAHRAAAGKALNVAHELTRLGTRCVLTGFVGKRSAGSYRAGIEALEYPPERCEFEGCEGEVRENLTLLVAGQTIKINRAGAPCTAENVEHMRERLEGLLRDCEGAVCVFTGSMPDGMTAQQYMQLMSAAANMGARLVIDTDVLTAQQLCELRPWLIKPNEHELASICGLHEPTTGELVEAAKELSQSGVGTVLLTLGANGLVCVTGGEVITVPPEQVELHNTVGAGDRALAGFLHAHSEGGSTEQCAKAASLSGAGIV